MIKEYKKYCIQMINYIPIENLLLLTIIKKKMKKTNKKSRTIWLTDECLDWLMDEKTIFFKVPICTVKPEKKGYKKYRLTLERIKL